jgi:L-asparaginase
MAHFLIINTGGTIGMVDGPRGLEPSEGVIEHTLNNHPDLLAWRLHRLSWLQWQPLLDSSELTPDHWFELKSAIVSSSDIDGVLIIHGTDTLSYSAAALSFLLTDCTIPVVITGSMLPIGANNTDAIHNLALALTGLESSRAEVAVAVGNYLLPGAKTSKATTFSHHAFIASQWQPSDWGNAVPTALNPITKLDKYQPNNIGVFTLFPGCPLDGLSHMLDQSYRAIIINAFGNGNAQSSVSFRQLLVRAKNSQIPIFIRSQCPEGHVDFSKYAAGALFKDGNAIECGHMSFEAVITKLQLLSSVFSESEQLVKYFKQPLSREWQ